MSRRYRIQARRNLSIILKVVGFLLIGCIVLGIVYLGPLLFQYAKPGIHLTKTNPDQHVTVLLLGIGGGNHDGPLLTDTIQFASIDPQHNTMNLVSIPRDLWNPAIGQKINATYAEAEGKQKGSGLQVTKDTISRVIGQPISYGFRIDFGGFVKAVDEVGGIDVNVARTLDDYAYPIEGSEDNACGHTPQEIIDLTAQEATGSATDQEAFPCRYMHLHISSGMQHMDGQTALEYVRSRHAMGIEGTDFARSARQQKVIEAFRTKLLSTGTLLNPSKIVALLGILRSSIDTDISQNDIPDFIKLAQQMKTATIHSYVIDYTDDPNDQGNLLIQGDPSSYGGAYVLIPRAGSDNYSHVQAFVACKINNIGCPTPTPNPTIEAGKALTPVPSMGK